MPVPPAATLGATLSPTAISRQRQRQSQSCQPSRAPNPATPPAAHSRYQSPRLLAHCHYCHCHCHRLAHLTLSLPCLPCTSLRQASRRPTSSLPLPLRVLSFHQPGPLDRRRRRPPEEPRPPRSLCICGTCTSCPPGLQPRRYTFTATYFAHRYIEPEVSRHSRTHSIASCHATSLRLHVSSFIAVSSCAASRAYDHDAGIVWRYTTLPQLPTPVTCPRSFNAVCLTSTRN